MGQPQLQKTAHDPGDPQVASHCPFCGSGAIVGRSDGTISCDMCGMNFLIRVQPAFPGMPQAPGEVGAATDVGPEGMGGLMPPPGDEMAPGEEEELGPDGMPLDEEEAAEEGEAPPWAEDEEGADEGIEDDGAEEEDNGGPPPPPKGKSKKKSSRRTAAVPEFGPVPSDDLASHLMGHHGWSAEDIEDYEGGLWDDHEHEHSQWTPAMIPGTSRRLPGGVIPHLHRDRGYAPYSSDRLLPYSLSARRYRTITGALLHEDAYVRHLAVLHSGGHPAVLALLRSQAQLSGPLGSIRVVAGSWRAAQYEGLAHIIGHHPDDAIRQKLAERFTDSLHGSSTGGINDESGGFGVYRPSKFRDAAMTPGYRGRMRSGNPNFTRTHYEHMAHVLNTMDDLSPGQRAGAAAHFAEHLQGWNPRFRQHIFFNHVIRGGDTGHRAPREPGWSGGERGRRTPEYAPDYAGAPGRGQWDRSDPGGLRPAGRPRPEWDPDAPYHEPAAHEYRTHPTDPEAWDDPFSMEYGPEDKDRPIDPVFGAQGPRPKAAGLEEQAAEYTALADHMAAPREEGGHGLVRDAVTQVGYDTRGLKRLHDMQHRPDLDLGHSHEASRRPRVEAKIWREPLPDNAYWRQMKAGHRMRTGHELEGHLETGEDGISQLVRHCCGFTPGDENWLRERGFEASHRQAAQEPPPFGSPWVAAEEDGRPVCRSCGYNRPYHETRCKERGLSDLQVRLEIANMSDAQSRERCTQCGRAIGAGGAVIKDGGLAHKFDCTKPGIW